MPRLHFLRLATIVPLAALVSSAPAIAQLATTGRWVGNFEFKDPAQLGSAEVAIHLAVLRGRADSTHAFYFTHGDQTRLVLNPMAGASAPHVNIPYRDKCATDYFESFCSGHSPLGDGRLFIAGGEVNISGQAPSGSKFAGIFDPRDYGSALRGWTLPDAMVDGRYYPTCSTMPDGTVLVTQGDQHFEMLTYGGYNASDVPQKDARTYAITAASPFWRNETVVTSGPTQFDRVGHTATYLAGGITSVALFGGKTDPGPSGQTLQDLQFIYRRHTGDANTDWELFEGVLTVGAPPSKRWFHAAAGAPGGAEVVFYGGQDEFGAIRNDVARLQPEGGLNYKWVNPASTGPARWRHSVAYDPGPAGSPADSARILVFGGRETASALADNALWAGRLTSPIQWYVAVGPSTDPNAAPVARERHAAFFRAVNGVIGPMVIFGGLDASNTLRNDAWVLERSATSFDYSWRKLNVGNNPPARMDLSMSYDPQRGIIVIAGGDGNGEASGGQLADAWGLPLDLCSTGGNPDWYALPGMSALDARSGHASAFVTLPPFSNRVIGRFSTSAPPGQQWKLLWWAPKLMPFTYPFMFVLQNGHVAWAGPNGSGWNPFPGVSVNKTMILNPDSTSATRGWQPSPQIWSNNGAWGGSAVMYHVAPDSVRVMRCGGHHGGPGIELDATRTDVIAFGADGGSQGWARVATSSPGVLTGRRDHNLILLPTGEVLATGGKGPGQKAWTQIWNPDTRQWSGELAEDLRIRNYHSSAALLPDGRVLSVGGHDNPVADKNDRIYATIYEPPYLFDSTRPEITSALARATYQQIVTVCVNDENAIDRVALLRPAATTHAFDQNQRYIPLSFVRASSPSRLLVTMPANANLAPPGDYLLFVCDVTGGRSIPSEGRWISLHTPVGRDSCDTVRPAGGNWLTLQTEGCVPPSYGDIRLRWNVPADDTTLAASGQVKAYDLRYVLNSGTPPPFESWTLWPTTVTQLPGGIEQIVVNGLPNSWHRFAMRPTDDNQNASVLSNQVVARPLWCEDGFSGGSGGGGGGSLLGEASAVTSVEGMNLPEAQAFRENSLLHGLTLGERGRDRMRLVAPPSEHAGSWSVVLRHSGQGGVNLGHARLLLADHAEGTEVVAGPTGLFAGTLLPATRVLDGEAGDRTGAARGEAPEPVHANAGEVLDVELPEGDVLVLEAEASDDPATTGIQVDVPTESGGWSSVATLHPRRNADRVALEGIVAPRVRLRFLGAHALGYVGRLAGATRLTAVEAAPSSAASARQGDVLSAVLAEDAVTLSIDTADTVQLSFTASPTPTGMVRDCFLEVEGARLARSGVQSARLTGAETPALTTLLPSMPNPAQAMSRLRFALQEPAWVTLDVHDAQGRLIKRYTGTYGAGVHAIEWDLRDLAGRRVAPGIYIQRLSVESSRMERSIVVLR